MKSPIDLYYMEEYRPGRQRATLPYIESCLTMSPQCSSVFVISPTPAVQLILNVLYMYHELWADTCIMYLLVDYPFVLPQPKTANLGWAEPGNF